MSRDWHIIDDADDADCDRPDEETRLDMDRIRLLARERRAAHRVRQWRIGVATLAALSGAILMIRASQWWREGEEAMLIWSAAATSVVLIVIAVRAVHRAGRLVPVSCDAAPSPGAFGELSDGSHRRAALRQLGEEHR